MNTFEMEGFLRGKCLPGDMKVNETNAEYLVRKFTELEQKLAESHREFRAADATIENLQMQLNAEREAKVALAAENAGLKSAHPQPFGPVMMKALDAYEKHQDETPETGMLDAFFILRDSIRVDTTATDAFLAEVRARVWIEGNEPAEFGRYWVRYETDVGPQYCSAKWIEHNFCAGSDTNIHKIWLADHSRSINSLKGVTHYTILPEPIEGGAK